MNAHGADISKYQVITDWDAFMDSIDFLIIRTSDGDTYDRNLIDMIEQALLRPKPLSFYHYLRPGTYYDVIKQMKFIEYITRGVRTLPLWADCENTGSLSKTTLTSKIKDAVEALADRAGIAPMIYTRASWWDYYLNRNSWAKDYKLVVAHYDVLNPTIPLDWLNYGKTYTKWQKTENGVLPGIQNSVDLVDYNGDLAHFYNEFYGVPLPEPLPQAKVLIDGLRVRDAHNTSANILRYLNTNDVVDIYEVWSDANSTWYRISELQEWSAKIYYGNVYMQDL